MIENLLIRHCAPTLAGLKTANLVNMKRSEAILCIESCGETLRRKGIETAILGERKDGVLLYIYRKNRLSADLKNSEATSILQHFGYESADVDECIEHLRERIAESPCFPHEIGLFLGYPAPDVKGFIEHKGQNFKCMGYWKVYCNECEALKTFARYKKCIDVYTRVYHEGTTIDTLTVAV